MNEEHLKQFLSRIMSDHRLQDQLKTVADKSEFIERLIRLGRDCGFEFSAEDVEQVLVRNRANTFRELNDEDLELVAGGRPLKEPREPGSWTCIFDACS